MTNFESDDWVDYTPYTREPGVWQHRCVADPSSAMRVALAPEGTAGWNDGRSGWFWLLTPDGDIMLACFPQGDTFMAVENDWGRP